MLKLKASQNNNESSSVTLISMWRVRIELRFSVRRFTTVTAQTVGLIKCTAGIYSRRYRTNTIRSEHHCAAMKSTRLDDANQCPDWITRHTSDMITWGFPCKNSHFEEKDQWLHSLERKGIEIELLLRHADAQLSNFLKTTRTCRKTHCCECVILCYLFIILFYFSGERNARKNVQCNRRTFTQ